MFVVRFCCELLSNFISLTDWKQHNLDKELSHNYLDYVSRIKNPISLSDFLFIYGLFFCSEQFKLKILCRRFSVFLLGKQFH